MEGNILPNFKTYFTAIVVKIVQYWQRESNTWTKRENPEIDPQKYAQFLAKVQKQFSGGTTFPTNAAEANGHVQAKKKMNFNLSLISYAKITQNVSQT